MQETKIKGFGGARTILIVLEERKNGWEVEEKEGEFMAEKVIGRRGKMETPRGTVLIVGLGETGRPLLEIIEKCK